jgi:hypothetical protein
LGRDLVAELEQARDEAARAFTVERLIDEYLKRRVRGRLRSAGDVELRLKRTLTGSMKRRASEIRRRDLRDLFNAVADGGHPAHSDRSANRRYPPFCDDRSSFMSDRPRP